MELNITARSYIHSGLSVIPTLPDKRPACAWKTFTERIMTDSEVDRNFSRADGIGIVCGRVSGNLELLDFDEGGRAFEPWFCTIPKELAQRLLIETTPSGGRHVYYRVGDAAYAVPGNRKLAMTAEGRVLIETRGEGGYVKCAPSNGYELVAGDFLHVPTVSPIEEQLMINTALALDERVEKAQVEGQGQERIETFHSTPTPWDDYNARGDFAALLEKHGWKRTKGGENEHWERPGKDEHSTSATWNGTVFFVFSSNAENFEPNRGYNKFQVFAALECGGETREAVRRLRSQGYGGMTQSFFVPHVEASATANMLTDPGPLPEEFLHVPGFVEKLTAHTMKTAPYPNRPLAFAGALAMLAHLTGRNFRNERNLRTNIYLLALANSGVGKDFPRKVNMNLAAEIGIMPTMADRFASAEGLEDALLIHPTSMFAVDEIDTLFAALNEKGDSAMEKIYGALLQFATSADTTYAMRKKAISQVGGKQSKFDKIRARGIREPHLTLLGTGIPKYLWSAISTRAMENGLLSRCLVLEAGERGKAGTPHHEPFDDELLRMARRLVSHGGFEGLDLEELDDEPPPYIEPITIVENPDAAKATRRVTAECEKLYDASTDTAAKALWTRGAEKTGKLALLYAISENVDNPLITPEAVEWAWKVVRHLTERTLFQASVYVHESEFDGLRQKAIRYLRDYGNGSMNHGALLRYMHVDSDTFRRVIETLQQSELITATELTRGGIRYTLV